MHDEVKVYVPGRKELKIVAIGGGHGLSTMLRGLKRYTKDITAIVTVADDGGGLWHAPGGSGHPAARRHPQPASSPWPTPSPPWSSF